MSDRTAVACTHCGHMYALPRAFLGKKATCKACGQKFVAVESVLPGKSTAVTASPLPSPATAVVLPSKREVPIPKPIRAEIAAPKQTRGDTLDDSVLDWLNDAGDDEAPPPPRVVTAADLCDPSQRVPQRGPQAHGGRV